MMVHFIRQLDWPYYTQIKYYLLVYLQGCFWMILAFKSMESVYKFRIIQSTEGLDRTKSKGRENLRRESLPFMILRLSVFN